MAKIHTLKISNFRGIKEFSQTFFGKNFVCLIGQGDSGKSTILEAISYALSSNWNLIFYDTDFHNCDITKPILIEIKISHLPEKLLCENRFGLYCSFVNTITGKDEDLEDDSLPVLTICLEVDSTLEPKWYVKRFSDGATAPINAHDRSLTNMFMVSDYIDKHFTWTRGAPLYSNTLKDEASCSDVLEIMRNAKQMIDDIKFDSFNGKANKIKDEASRFGVEIKEPNATIEPKDIVVRDGKLTLHDGNIPLRYLGKGSKRIVSTAIQLSMNPSNSIILIDEIEQGLEPYRVQNFVSELKKSDSQIFVTTHSRDVVVELVASDLFKMKRTSNSLLNLSPTFQNVIRKNPEALFAKKIIVCEGATEVGIYMAIRDYLKDKGSIDFTMKGLRYADGTGSNLIEYTYGFHKMNYSVALFCDSDTDDKVADKKISDSKTFGEVKNDLLKEGLCIIDCEKKNSIEMQIINDLPWEGILHLMECLYESRGRDAVLDIFASTDKKYTQEWLKNEEENSREIIGKVIGKHKLFKHIEEGKILGNTIMQYYDKLSDSSRIYNNIQKIIDWSNHD